MKTASYVRSSEFKPAGIDIRCNGNQTFTFLVRGQIADHQEAKRNAPEKIALEVKAFKPFLDISGVAFDGNCRKRR